MNSERTDHIATLTPANPHKINAINAAMEQELLPAVLRLGADADTWCVILRGAGPVFASGGDIEELRKVRAAADTALASHEAVGGVLQAIGQLPQPGIASIQGPCAGAGMEIACACGL